MKHAARRTPLALLVALTLSLVGWTPVASARSDDEPAGPTEEEVAAEVTKLEKVLADGAYDEKVAALVEAREFPHDDVVSAVTGAIKDKAKEVRICAVTSLGYLHVDSALRELHKLTKKKALVEDQQFAIELFRAIGRHADKKSLKYLEDNILSSAKPVLECRILAIARVRDIESVEMIVSLMNKLRSTDGGKGEPKGGREDVPHMATIQLALHVLTGANEGVDRGDWQKWWNDKKHDIKVTDEYPTLERALETKWKEFWDETGGDGRKGKDDKGENGSDGEDGGGDGGGGDGGKGEE